MDIPLNLLEKSSLHSQDFELKSTKFARTHHIILETHRLQHSELQFIVFHAGGKQEPTICRPGTVMSCNVVLVATKTTLTGCARAPQTLL